jgi:hypothetical protein
MAISNTQLPLGTVNWSRAQPILPQDNVSLGTSLQAGPETGAWLDQFGTGQISLKRHRAWWKGLNFFYNRYVTSLI